MENTNKHTTQTTFNNLKIINTHQSFYKHDITKYDPKFFRFPNNILKKQGSNNADFDNYFIDEISSQSKKINNTESTVSQKLNIIDIFNDTKSIVANTYTF